MDIYRPVFHFTSKLNWMNDPNGPFHHNGEYHLFYQHNPDKPEWGNIHWGHAKSKDLVNWEHLPVALFPSNERGENHCFSGCSIVETNKVTLFYTSIGSGDRNAVTGSEQWTAHSSGDLMNWEKSLDNPALTRKIHGNVNIEEWRDPYVWRETDGWRMLLGGVHEGKGCAALYRSSDLHEWEFAGFFHKGNESIWECPHVFKFDHRYVLFYSPSGEVRYVTGTVDEQMQLQPITAGYADHGGWEGFYASTGFTDLSGRRILLGWMPEGSRGEDFPLQLDWAGALALPRVVRLKDNGKIAMAPVPELSALRGDHSVFHELAVHTEPYDTGIRSRAYEAYAKFDLVNVTEPIVISVLRSNGGEEETRIVIDPSARTILIDRAQSSLFPGTHKSCISGKLPESENGLLNLRLFVDHSVIELFVGDEVCLTSRVYPSLADSDGLTIYAGSQLLVSRFEVWQMKHADMN